MYNSDRRTAINKIIIKTAPELGCVTVVGAALSKILLCCVWWWWCMCVCVCARARARVRVCVRVCSAKHIMWGVYSKTCIHQYNIPLAHSSVHKVCLTLTFLIKRRKLDFDHSLFKPGGATRLWLPFHIGKRPEFAHGKMSCWDNRGM